MTRITRPTRSLILASLLAAVAGPAGAATFLALDLDDLVAGADRVVEGQVLEVRSSWNADRTVIRTRATFRVDAVVLGDAPPIVSLDTPGGTVGEVRVTVPGFPTFEPGERLLLFLEDAGEEVHRVHGYRQGQYRIVTDASGERIAEPALAGNALLLGAEGKDRSALGGGPLVEFKSSIRAAADRLAAGGGSREDR